ncbi:cysteine desulfurase family protein [Neptunicoccus cionae]|uniref:cysteine desulfurase family protein n=1 Tax=Neptunicoccus cionae TaxID=2035344 RepID=UPI000C78274F|nr:aminotransferase class V-fold PLP-dependent enzyme [Amylibacter cionae]PLS20607.1 aminotransferase [Amylibacter cionae]
MTRVYLDWNATAPLRDEARSAMLAAMDAVGNPSSVHAEGRKALAIVERARVQIKAAFGVGSGDLVFTSGATEGAALVLNGREISCGATEHDAVHAWCDPNLPVDGQGRIAVESPENSALQAANSETGILQGGFENIALCDAVQAFGKIPFAFEWSGAQAALLSAHKIGGPKGIGAVVLQQGQEVPALIKGGGQEQGRRSGTENVIGIAGFGAAAEAAQRDLDSGLWEQVAILRDELEARLADEAPDADIIGRTTQRLPNTSCIAVAGWKGETQVMQMDLAGYAISAGSACSSGKVKQSRVLKAMGFDDTTASSAIRVSFGPATTRDEVMGFAEAWLAQYRKFKARAA